MRCTSSKRGWWRVKANMEHRLASYGNGEWDVDEHRRGEKEARVQNAVGHMPARTARGIWSSAAALLLLPLVACGGDPAPTSPSRPAGTTYPVPTAQAAGTRAPTAAVPTAGAGATGSLARPPVNTPTPTSTIPGAAPGV